MHRAMLLPRLPNPPDTTYVALGEHVVWLRLEICPYRMLMSMSTGKATDKTYN